LGTAAPFPQELGGEGLMGLLVVALATVVAALGMILFAVHKIRPRSLRFRASATRWLSLSLEIEAPQQTNRREARNGH
jgi:hypothetical protein